MPNSGGSDSFIIRYSSDGKAIWGAKLASSNNDIGWGISMNNLGDIVSTGSYDNAQLTVYNGGTSLQTTAFTMENSGNTDIFIVKYTDQQFLSPLGNPSADGQIKKIYSTGPQVLIDTVGSLNYLNQNIYLYRGQSIEMIWDAQQSNWVVLNLTGTLV